MPVHDQPRSESGYRFMIHDLNLKAFSSFHVRLIRIINVFLLLFFYYKRCNCKCLLLVHLLSVTDTNNATHEQTWAEPPSLSVDF